MGDGVPGYGCNCNCKGTVMTRTNFCGGGLAIVFTVTSFASAAEEGKDRKGPPPGALPPGLQKLDLSQEQREQIRAILRDARAKLEEARQDKDREAAQKIRQETHGKIMDVLTEEQREQLKKMRDAHEGKRPKKGPPPRDCEGKGPPPGKKPRGDR